MADALAISGTAIGVWDQVTAIYEKIKDIKDLPKSLRETDNKLALVERALKDVKKQLEEAPETGDDQKAIASAIKDCESKAKDLQSILEKIPKSKTQDNLWASIKTFYKSAVLSLGKGKKGRVEDLMQDIIGTLNVLVARKVLQKSESFVELKALLASALEKLVTAAQEEPSLSESECEDTAGNVMNVSGNAKGNFANEHKGDNHTSGAFSHHGTGNMTFGTEFLNMAKDQKLDEDTG